MSASPNVHSVGDIAEVRTWDAQEKAYLYKPVRIRAFTPHWVKFTYIDTGASGSQEYAKVKRV